MVRWAHIAIDGSKSKAVDNRDCNFTKRKIARRPTNREVDVHSYIDEIERIVRQENGEVHAAKVANRARGYGRIRQEIAQLKVLHVALSDAPEGQITLTDPDARAMATSARRSGLVGYNVQSAVDTETHPIVAHVDTNMSFDRDQLAPMAKPSTILNVCADQSDGAAA